MKARSRVFSHSLKFSLAFLAFSLFMGLAFVLGLVLSSYIAQDLSVTAGLPLEAEARPEDIDWRKVADFDGYGLLIDKEGKILKSYNRDLEGTFDLFDSLDRAQYLSSDETLFAYNSPGGKKLVLIYPSKAVTLQPTITYDGTADPTTAIQVLIPLAIFILYLVGAYLLIRQLQKRLREDEAQAYVEDKARQDELFMGLAHDMKTPLASVLAYASALEDGLARPGEEKAYYEKIKANALVLEKRLDDMVAYSSLAREDLFQPQESDLLEHVRRYVGDSYSWFADQGARIQVLFPDDLTYQTPFDPDLVDRALQNLLVNSVDHNDPPVTISLDFKGKCLIIKDDGPGIDEDLWIKIFEPMVTGDASRTGKKNRGLGLANVQRIALLHGWQAGYDQRGFFLDLDPKKSLALWQKNNN